jgi:putative PEP-CTERM system histidine kinase
MAASALGGTALLHSAMTICLSLALRGYPEAVALPYLRIALAGVALSTALMVVFSFYHARLDAPLFPGIKRVAVPLFLCLGVVFAALSWHTLLLEGLIRSGDQWSLRFGPLGTPFHIYVIFGLLVIFYQLEQNYRATAPMRRIRLKLLTIGIVSGAAYALVLASVALLYHALAVDLLVAGSLVFPVCWVLIHFAVVRHRLLEVDIFISRHVVFTSIATVAVGLYLMSIGAGAYLIRGISGRWDLLVTAVFLSMAVIVLGLLLFSERLQRRIKRFIHFHFYRYKYDYRLEWNEFTRKISTVHDLPNVLLKVIEMISETLWVNQISVWLYNDRAGTLSFTVSRNLPRKAEFLRRETPLGSYLLEHRAPLTLEGSEARTILETHEDLFQRFNIAMVVPLKSGPDLVGMITLGPGMRGVQYTDEDAELMTVIADQASSAIISAQLIEEVAASREAESFNKLSSFLVHDLKNLVSSISLALQNADRNITKPEFQKDLLATLTRTVEKMQTLIEKLSTLPKELELKAVPLNLNTVIADVLKSSQVEKIRNVEISADLNEIPQVQADGEYVRKVLVNLIFNAVQALPNGTGRIELTSYAADEFVHVEVLDTGEGMPEEFVQKQLFRPFSSTKKKGLGIGLYQSKAIMEAHGGAIKVHSIPNRGSQFILSFPIYRES